MNYLKGVLFSLVFFAIITIISLWSSYVFRFAPLILIVSVAVTYFLTKQFKLELFQISSSAIYLSLAIAFLVAHPFLFVTPFVDASADPAAHISALAITDSIPETYAPFSYLEYRYQIGFPLLAKMFIDLLPFVSSNFIVWLLGVIFTFLSAILIYTISREFFDDEKAGLIALALFFGSKIIFQNMFWGQYTFILASVFFLATLLTFQKKNKLAYLFFPIIFIAHPGVGFYALIFFGLWTLIYKNYSESLKLFLSGLIALPSFFITYIHFLSNFGNEGIPLTISSLIDNSLIFTLWIGGLIFVLGILGLAFIIYKKDFSKLNLLLISSFIVSGLISILLSASGKILGGRVVELAMFSGLFLSVYFVLKLVNSKQKLFIPAFFLILILSFGLFLTSSQLFPLKSGS